MKRFVAAVLGSMSVALAGLVPLTSGGTAVAADASCAGYSSVGSTCTNAQRTIAGESRSTDWYVPTGTASAVMVFQNGFSRNCAHLRGTSKAIAEKGVMVVCVNGDMTAGAPELANRVAEAVAAGTLTPPAGRAMPTKVIAGGHSAGGHFAGRFGARLSELAPSRLQGAVLFDPVAQSGFTADLEAISDGGARPVVSVAARPSVSNLFNNSYGALNGLANGFVGIQLVWEKYTLGFPVGGSCHTDVEGENTDFLGSASGLCSPNATQTSRLRDFGSTWARDIAIGTRTAAYWCTDKNVVSTCGSKVKDLVDRSLPVAAPIR
ncbi:alpha/beta hydrolase [Nocardioides yefusunii]|uniref:Alpha/beta hydrolase n=1 Tax=Nocardioides yefusunii TaxID=2500546 RepID=A0ABW1QW44_9ACTN|nr:alpha/beta hydrolase [Nocardioides yefusunii]